MCVRLVLLACRTALDILAHKLHEAWPPELGGDELMGLKITGVAGGFVVVTMGEDGTVEGVHQGDIDMSFVGQNMIFKLPQGCLPGMIANLGG